MRRALTGVALWTVLICGGAAQAQEEHAAGPPPMSMQDRYQHAKGLMESGQDDEAAAAFEWLWRNTGPGKERGFSGVRVSFMANDMEELAGRHEGARAAFTALRDESAAAMTAKPTDSYRVTEWLVLSEVVGDRAAILMWFDGVKNDPRQMRLIASQSLRLEPMLLEEERWSDIAIIHPDPIASFNQAVAFDRMTPDRVPGIDDPEFVELMARMRKDQVRGKAGTLYAAMLAAGRVNDAEKLAAKACEHDPSPKMTVALVRTALIAGEPRAEHLEWLHEASKQGEATDGLFQQVEAALRARS
ncbi:MAG: hypothetical protein IBJ10_01735 [Phycisphaerales bacterium]|nr:hypothetical protein [Phycisphaerales bacterium]